MTESRFDVIGTWSLADRGLAYGDGLFETLRIAVGEPTLWQRHLKRLSHGAWRLKLPLPDPDLILSRGVALAAGQSGVLRITLTRGSGARGYSIQSAAEPCVILRFDQDEHHAVAETTPVVLWLCDTRLSHNPRLAGLKHLNRLEQVLARSEWDDPAVAEGLVLDVDGNLVECISSNIFWRHGGTVMTPLLDRSGVSGVLRAELLELPTRVPRLIARPVREVREGIDALMNAHEVFICNSVMGVRPVIELKGRSGTEQRWPAGALGQRLQAHCATLLGHDV